MQIPALLCLEQPVIADKAPEATAHPGAQTLSRTRSIPEENQRPEIYQTPIQSPFPPVQGHPYRKNGQRYRSFE